jgi:hypothetical protein
VTGYADAFPAAEGIGMARGKQSTTGDREHFWREQLRRQQASGQGVREFCQGAGLSVPSFYWWRREVRIRDARRHGLNRPRFVPVRIAPRPATGGGVEVSLASGRVIRVGPDFDADHLRAVVAALEAAPC